jgi:hypothetical protein
MDFLNHRERGMVFYQVFLLYPEQCSVTFLNCRNCKRLREFGVIEISRLKAVEVTVNSREENSSEFFLDFGQEFGLCTVILLRSTLRPTR